MIYCKKHIIAAGFTLLLPLVGWSQAPVVDESEHFAMLDEQQAYEAPVVNPKYDEPEIEAPRGDIARNDDYSIDIPQDDGPALVKEDGSSESKNNFNANANLIDKIQSLQQELQELRGQLEVQAHDLKLLQQQQVAFYKDLDSRLGSSSGKALPSKAPTDLSLGPKPTPKQAPVPVAQPQVPTATSAPANAVIPVSRANPADEQISYMAAYELLKNKHYEDATNAMLSFVQKYPNGGYTANAEYWLGELFLVKKEYPKAIEHFDVVLTKFPSSSKSAASMLKSGYAFASTGNNAEAKKRLQQVVKTYPGTPTAQLASSKLKSIHAL